jgi:hypothetical protein
VPARLSRAWRARGVGTEVTETCGFVPGVRQQVIGRGYPVFSWYSIMAGMGIFPGRYRMSEIDNLW